jgi:hypothetical protein
MVDLATTFWMLRWGARILRGAGGKKVIYAVRDRSSIGLLRPLHFNVIHRMRRLSVQMTDESDDPEAAAHLALELCTQCRTTMCRLLELNSNELHCCLKLMVTRPGAPDEDRVATWARSEPLDDRPIETGDANAHLVNANSVWSALMGRNDGITGWRPFSCFACNDLTKRHELFKCDRENWTRYYKSTLVFPLRYQENPQCTSYRNIGFLAFDSHNTSAFKGLPDIFDFRDDPSGYRDLLEDCTAFHLGAIFADTLSGFLRTAYERKHLGGA